MGPGRDAMLGGAFLIKFDAFRSVATSKRFSFIRSGHLNTTDGNLTCYPRYAGRKNNKPSKIKTFNYK